MSSFFYNALLTMGADSPSMQQGQTMPGNIDAGGLLNRVIDKSDSGIVLLVVVIVVGLIVALPMLYKLITEGRKYSKESDQKFIDVITKNNEAFSSLKETLANNNTTIDKSLQNIEEMSAASSSNMAMSVTYQIQLDKVVSRLLQHVVELGSKLDDAKSDIDHIKDVQSEFAENQAKIIEIVSGNSTSVGELAATINNQTELLNSVSVDIEKLGKKVSAAKKSTASKKKKEE